MLDVVAAAGVRVAADAVLDGRDATVVRHAARHRAQVDVLLGVGQAGIGLALHVGAGLVVADQAVDVLHVVEVEVLVVVAVARVTLRAAALVGRDGDAEVVDQVVLAVGPLLETGDVRRHAFPGEVCPHQHVGADQAVAVEAVVRAGVFVFREIAGMLLLYLGSVACYRVAVENVDVAVAVEILFRVADAVSVEVPASYAVRAIGPRRAIHTVNAIGPRCAIVSFTTGDPKSEKHADQKAGKATSHARSPCHFWSPQVK